MENGCQIEQQSETGKRSTATACYVVKCYNEWCDGPETWKICDEMPIGPQKCPSCGWLALPENGIHKVST